MMRRWLEVDAADDVAGRDYDGDHAGDLRRMNTEKIIAGL